jgi:hypothetical protein
MIHGNRYGVAVRRTWASHVITRVRRRKGTYARPWLSREDFRSASPSCSASPGRVLEPLGWQTTAG